MRTLKYAILGLLNKQAMTGYTLSKEFNSEIAQFWNANHSQIYPELKKLVSEELVTYDIEISGDILEKKSYTLTEKGRKEFMKWLQKEEPIEKISKDIFRLRMYFSNNLNLETRIQLLESQLIQHEVRLKSIQQTIAQYTTIPDIHSDRFGDFIVIEGAIFREQAMIQWLKKCIDYCRNVQ